MLRLIGLLAALFTTGLVLQACAEKPLEEASCNFVQNGSLQRVSWGSQVPVVMYIDSSVPNEFTNDIKAAAAVWNKEIGREVIKIGGYVDSKTEPAQDGHNIIYYRSTWESDKANEQARTTVYWAGDRIYEADLKINASVESRFTFSSGDHPEVGRIDMESLIVHEFGHVLGLAHSAAAKSVMARSLPTLNTASTDPSNQGIRRNLSASDEESVRCEY